MAIYQYCTPDWLEESARIYEAKPEFQEKLKKLSAKVCYRVKAESSWGIEKDILFGTFVDSGRMTRLSLIPEEEAKKDADYILSATPKEWKKILRKENKFVTDFMLGRIKLEMGSKVGVLGLAPHSNTIIDVLTQVELQFPDEMSEEELGKYETFVKKFRSELGV
jgi:hypothetical protein